MCSQIILRYHFEATCKHKDQGNLSQICVAKTNIWKMYSQLIKFKNHWSWQPMTELLSNASICLHLWLVYWLLILKAKISLNFFNEWMNKISSSLFQSFSKTYWDLSLFGPLFWDQSIMRMHWFLLSWRAGNVFIWFCFILFYKKS